jgi:hypothetical protein
MSASPYDEESEMDNAWGNYGEENGEENKNVQPDYSEMEADDHMAAPEVRSPY